MGNTSCPFTNSTCVCSDTAFIELAQICVVSKCQASDALSMSSPCMMRQQTSVCELMTYISVFRGCPGRGCSVRANEPFTETCSIPAPYCGCACLVLPVDPSLLKNTYNGPVGAGRLHGTCNRGKIFILPIAICIA